MGDELLARNAELIEQRDALQLRLTRLTAEREGIFLALAEWCLPGQSPTEAIRQLREFLDRSEQIRREQARRLRRYEATAGLETVLAPVPGDAG